MHRQRALFWQFAWVGVAVVTAIVAYPIARAVADILAATGQDPQYEAHGWGLTLFVVVWLALAFSGLVAVSAALFGRDRVVVLGALPWLIAGAAIGGGLEFTLVRWGAARFGSSGVDSDAIGATAFLAVVVVAVAIGVLAQLVVPSARTLARLWTIAMAAVASLIVLSNVPGLFDGIEPASLPLATAVALSGGYALSAAVLSVRRRPLHS